MTEAEYLSLQEDFTDDLYPYDECKDCSNCEFNLTCSVAYGKGIKQSSKHRVATKDSNEGFECLKCRGTGVSTRYRGVCYDCSGKGKVSKEKYETQLNIVSKGISECHRCKGTGKYYEHLAKSNKNRCYLCDGTGKISGDKLL